MNRTTKRIVRLLPVTVAALALTAASAHAWTAPVNLSVASQDARDPQVAVDADGDAAFAWTKFNGATNRIQARTRSAAGAVSEIDTISPKGRDCTEPAVAVAADGDAAYAWTNDNGSGNTRVQMRTRTSGTYGPVQTLSDPTNGALQPDVAVNANGDAVFVWTRYDGTHFRVQTSFLSVGGVLSPVQTLSNSGRNALEPEVAIDSEGDAVYVWRRTDGLDTRIQGRVRTGLGGVLGPIQNLSGGGQNAGAPDVDVDDDGDAVFTWFRFDGSTNVIQARGSSAGGTLGAVQNLSAPGAFAGGPDVAVDSDGDAVFTWYRFDGTVNRAQARARSAAGALSGVQNLSAASPDGFSGAADDPHVAIDDGGDAVFTWRRSNVSESVVQARTRSAAGSYGPREDLSSVGASQDDPQISVGADASDAIAVWQRLNDPFDRIQASAGP